MIKDTPPHLRPIALAADTFARWRKTAHWIANVNVLLLKEVNALSWDCNAYSLWRCADVARYIAAGAGEPYAGAARSLAVEFEDMAGGAHP